MKGFMISHFGLHGQGDMKKGDDPAGLQQEEECYSGKVQSIASKPNNWVKAVFEAFRNVFKSQKK